MARRRRHGEEEPENHERWLISYADMITLLMIFFIIMYSISSLKDEKFKAFQDSYKLSFGSSETPPKDIIPDPKPSVGPKEAEKANQVEELKSKETSTKETPASSKDAAQALAEQMAAERERIRKQFEEELKKAGLADQVKVTVDSRGVVLLLTDQVLFVSGQADVLPQGRTLLRQLSPFLENKNKPLLIEGHTDSRPISTGRYRDNWDLSGDRAANVLRFLKTTGMPDKRMTIAGYADTHPRGSNATTSGRAANRRVELVVVVQPDSAQLGVALSSVNGAQPLSTGTSTGGTSTSGTSPTGTLPAPAPAPTAAG